MFTGLERLDDGMAGGVEMLGRVLILRRVAAADVTAGEAQAQMHPPVADLEAVFATACVRRDGVYLVQMRAHDCHVAPTPSSVGRQILMRELYRHGAFADRGCDALGGA